MNKMKIGVLILAASLMFIFSSCAAGKMNKEIQSTGLDKVQVDRIIITNNRYPSKYIVIDKNSLNRFKNKILKSADAAEDTKLEPDFTLDLYSDIKKVGSYKYLAGVSDRDTANLFDENGRKYHVDASIEDEFIKRIMKKDNKQNVPEYYTSFVTLLLKKTDPAKNSVAVVDISKDFFVTSSLTVMEQKRILDSIDVNNASIKFPKEVDNYDYYIKIDTRRYQDNSCKAYASVTDKNKVVVKYEIEGTYKGNKWSYNISYR